MKQINEVKRMQELAGLTKEAPNLPPVPGKSTLNDSSKEKYIKEISYAFLKKIKQLANGMCVLLIIF